MNRGEKGNALTIHEGESGWGDVEYLRRRLLVLLWDVGPRGDLSEGAGGRGRDLRRRLYTGLRRFAPRDEDSLCGATGNQDRLVGAGRRGPVTPRDQHGFIGR